MSRPAVPDDSEYLDIEQAAAYIGQTVRWMRYRVAEKSITFYKPGGLIRFRVDDLDAYMESVKVPAERKPPVRGRPRHAA